MDSVERRSLIDGVEETGSSPKPFDRGVYGICVLLGVGFLMPWNVIVNSLDYLKKLYPPTDSIGPSISFYITAASTYPALPLLFLMVRYGNALPAQSRVVAGFLLCTAVLVLMPALSPQSSVIPVALGVVSGLAQALLQSSLIGVTSLLPPVYSQGFMMGQGISGVLASLGQILVQGVAAGGGGGSSAPVYVFFGLGAATTLACVAGMLRLQSLPMAKRAMASAAAGVAQKEEEEEGLVAAEEAGGKVGAGDGEALLRRGGKRARARPSIASVMKRTWHNLLSVYLVFLVTFL
jgi:hypothetical protein